MVLVRAWGMGGSEVSMVGDGKERATDWEAGFVSVSEKEKGACKLRK
jgi:hypothetical protein